MAVARVWEEEWSAGPEVSRHLEVVPPAPPTPLRTGRTIAARRLARARMLRRRRRAALAAGVLITMVLLAWPAHAFGGETSLGQPSDLATSSQLTAGSIYVVSPHDTVSSIARRIDPADPRVAVRALTRELGSTYVVAGEHVLIP